MEAEDELYALPVWGAHRLTGDRMGTWSLHVTRNWRLTFRIDGNHIVDVDFEDYRCVGLFHCRLNHLGP